ncbi:MAG: hypothetical protein LBC73_01660 [Oscillospiraceae bacterium]|jgi:ABC-type glycerol-3-phosphate transport system substrate-binding protein|nr:hypothetical protein [Oscillospiraceae bacterium]
MRLKTLILLLAILFIVIVACGNERNADITDFIHVPEIIQFPEHVKDRLDMNNIIFYEETVYFTTSNNMIYSMNLKKKDFIELPNYSLFNTQDGTGSVYINKVIIDNNGFLWSLETVLNHGLGFTETNILRKLDNTGAELLSLDISEYLVDVRIYNVKICIDNEDNIYIGLVDKVTVIDNTSRFLFNLDVRNFWNFELIRMTDGTIANFDGQGTIRKIIVEEQGWGDTINLPLDGRIRVFNENNEFSVLFISGMALYGVDIETNDIALVLDFIDSDLMFDMLINVNILTNGQILIATFTARESLDPPVIELILFTKKSSSERQERTQLTLAGINIDNLILSAVVQFNRTSDAFRIHVIDYSVYNISADDSTALLRLNTDIITGRVPDILVLSELPFRQYAERGLFVDLGTFLDNDTEINRDDFISNVLRAAEIDGTLYQIFPAFDIFTIIGNPEIIGRNTGWTIEEFKAVLDANPEADIPIGTGMSKIRFLHFAFMYNVEQFIDWNSRVAFFDSDDFVKLLKLADIFPMEADPDIFFGFGAGWDEIIAGRQIMALRQLIDFDSYRFNRSLYGSEIVFKGFPGESRASGIFNTDSNIAISANSENQNVAWEFVRLILSDDFGQMNIHRSFPINKAVFEERLAKAMIPDGRSITSMDGKRIVIDEISVEESLQILSLIDSISSVQEHNVALWVIISENASDFFNGRISAEEAARIIQSRVLIYLSEQS